MKYISTRGNYKKVESAEAIRTGMVPKGGLFVPEEIPEFSQEDIEKMQRMNYQGIALKVLDAFLSDYTEEELKDCVSSAYNSSNFSAEDMVINKKLKDDLYVLELWHGPTAAFKDMALQLMPHLLVKAIEKVENDKEIIILVATSGDTGKAALEGFKDLEGIRIIVFYPDEGVSEIQKAQMITTEGENTEVVAVEGNFDDCQTAVKNIFADQSFNELIKEKGYQFSSANSINWGRLVPQIVYYFSSYATLLKEGAIKSGEKINITVPTGNFGNIFAAYYAYKMGLPVNKFLCASNDNKVLTDFLRTGAYDIDREFMKTTSPSMDILISSNLERFLFEITGQDAAKINQWYQDLKDKGRFEIDKETLEKINSIFIADYSSEKETKETIKEVFKEFDYTIDPHTAVGIKVYKKQKDNLGDHITIVDSTANPYKFAISVLEALSANLKDNEYENLKVLKEISGMSIHRGLQDLDKKEIRHDRKCHSNSIKEEIEDILGI
ncbi:threonine synthase [Natronospora cellulosivora (SeqCode)]